MNKCDVCGELGELDFMRRCEPCFRNYVMNVVDKPYGMGVMKNGYTVTAAHYDNITHRRIGTDGKVYQDRGQKSFMVNGGR